MRGLLFFVVVMSSVLYVFKAPFFGIMMWYIFSLMNINRLVYGTFASLPYAVIIALVTMIAWALSREKKSLPLSPIVVLTILFAIWMTFTSIVGLGESDLIWQKWSAVNKMLLMALIGLAMTTSRERINLLLWIMVVSIGFWGVKGGTFTILTGGSWRVWGPDGTEISDNNDLGLALTMIMPLLFFLWQTTASRYLRWGLAFAGFLILVAIIGTYSRGALLALSAMSIVFWLRARSKVPSAALVVAGAVLVYNFAPASWFDRMDTIETYDSDASAMSRLYMWQIGMKIVAQRPIVGGGFKMTYSPDITNKFLAGSDLPLLTKPRALHSSYFEVLAEHGYVGLVIWLAIAGLSLVNASFLIRRSKGKPEFIWYNLLGRAGQASLIGFWVGTATLSHAYYDGYWCALFIFQAARQVFAKELAAVATPHRASIPGVNVAPAIVGARPNTA